MIHSCSVQVPTIWKPYFWNIFFTAILKSVWKVWQNKIVKISELEIELKFKREALDSNNKMWSDLLTGQAKQSGIKVCHFVFLSLFTLPLLVFLLCSALFLHCFRQSLSCLVPRPRQSTWLEELMKQVHKTYFPVKIYIHANLVILEPQSRIISV